MPDECKGPGVGLKDGRAGEEEAVHHIAFILSTTRVPLGALSRAGAGSVFLEMTLRLLSGCGRNQAQQNFTQKGVPRGARWGLSCPGWGRPCPGEMGAVGHGTAAH